MNENQSFSLDQKVKDLCFIAFDTETTGAYPVQEEIVEFGAVKFIGNEVSQTFQGLYKPKEKMTDFIISIHGITNESVENCPKLTSEINKIHNLFLNTVSIAHHAPFDVGFICYEFEKSKLNLPKRPILCSSLISRVVIKETSNHKLQTLVTELNLQGGTAHRATDDALSCMQVFLKCLERLPADTTLKELLKIQAKVLDWRYYTLLTSQKVLHLDLVKAIEEKKDLDLVYGGSNSIRRVTPLGIVRNPDGDFMPALCHQSGEKKRFYLQKFKDWTLTDRKMNP